MNAPEPLPTTAVVIPVYNRGDALAKTLAGLAVQDYPAELMSVVVADDGSEDDIESIVAATDADFDIVYARQTRDGFGAGRARNLGATHSSSDVIVFLDSDGLTEPTFVRGHAGHHTGAEERVVIGGRVHIEARAITVEAIRHGVDWASSETTGHDDFRTLLARRTGGFTSTDEGYRAFVSSNVSMSRSLFEKVGGFDPRFRWWGSEDSEFGWRLWQAGARFVDDSGVRIFHQTDTDTAGGQVGRQRARELNAGLMSSLVPQKFYRKQMPDPIPEVPKFTVIVHDVPATAPREIWRSLVGQTLPDFNVIFVAEPQEHDPFAGASVGDPRVDFADSVSSAVEASTGEYLVFLGGFTAVSLTFLQNLRKRLDSRPVATSLSCGYWVHSDGSTYGRVEDVELVDSEWGEELPQMLAVRRRELILRLNRGFEVPAALDDLRHGQPHLHTRQALVALPGVMRADRPDPFVYGKGIAKQFWDELQLGPSQAVKASLKVAKQRLRPPSVPAPQKGEERIAGPPGIRYVGWVGKGNLGDEAMLDATRQLMSWGEINTRGEAGRLLLLGGGTLINRNQYLGWLQERDSPRIERAVFGTGVASTSYWGVTEDSSEWLRWLQTCAYVGLRGPRSAETLQRWGFKGPLEVCGDPALALTAPGAVRKPGSVVISPAWTDGQLWGESDIDVYRSLAQAAARWQKEGREITFLACHPTDDRPILMIRDMMERNDTSYVAGYLDVQGSLEVLAAADFVVGERLHACVLAAATSRPFIAVEYRPKLMDFSESVGMSDYVVRTDALEPDHLLELGSQLGEAAPARMLSAVEEYRERLRSGAETIRAAVEA
ncbi:MAG: glycosyltransferase [Acidimicrobiia bacterium]